MTTPAAPGGTDPSSAAPVASTAVADLAATLDTPAPVFSLDIKGTVTAVFLTSSPPTITASLNGDTANPVAGIRFIDSYSPVVGDTVLLSQQGSDVFALGQINNSVNGTSANGWQTPSLASGVTTYSSAPIQYRIVVDNGDNRVQFKGCVNISGTPTTLWTMSGVFVPAVQRQFIVVRNDSGNACEWAMVYITTGGVVSLSQVHGETSTSSSTGGHTHGGGSYQTSGNTTSNGSPSHTHSYTAGLGGQSDNQGNHGHTVPLSGTAPTFLCFDSISYFTA